MPDDVGEAVLVADVDALDEEELATGLTAGSLIAEIRIKGLFGRYDYDLIVPEPARAKRLLLLYGDNGTGKTTVLRLIWHLLSPSRDRRHRHSIAAIAFASVEVVLVDGRRIVASRLTPSPGPYNLLLTIDGVVHSEAEWPGDATFNGWTDDSLELAAAGQFGDSGAASAIANTLEQRRYVQFLEELAAKPYFLADDRNVYSDDLAPGESRLRRDPLRSARVQGADDDVASIAQEVDASMSRAGSFLTRLALGGTASGSRGANSVYLDVLRQLGAATESTETEQEARTRLLAQVSTVGQRHIGFQDLGLVPRFPTDEFELGIRALPDGRLTVADEVLTPFLQSLDARLDALQDAQKVIATFLREANGFLRDKELAFRPQRGLSVRTIPDGQALRPAQLSSGERHLTLLLCNAVLARRDTRVFLVDEPELSLNVKWQRKVVSALLACTEASPVQFVMATHSLELLSEYQDCVVRLKALPSTS
jgi:energy-coupling factor transporter ATP-binding protein EcfA2